MGEITEYLYKERNNQPKNILFVSGVGGGKTVAMNTIALLGDLDRSTVIIEDVEELNGFLPSQNVIRWTKESFWKEELTEEDYYRAVSKYNPYLVIDGEVRGVEVIYIGALALTGTQVFTTIHGGSMELGLSRYRDMVIQYNNIETDDSNEYATELTRNTWDLVLYSERTDDGSFEWTLGEVVKESDGLEVKPLMSEIVKFGN